MKYWKNTFDNPDALIEWFYKKDNENGGVWTLELQSIPANGEMTIKSATIFSHPTYPSHEPFEREGIAIAEEEWEEAYKKALAIVTQKQD